MNQARVPLTIDVVSDVVCPWCFLGKRRLETALKSVGEDAVVRWRPYQLDPSIPKQGMDRDAYLETKFGKGDGLKHAHDRLTLLGDRAGIRYRFDAIRRSPNTIDAHRLIRWAAARGVQEGVVERLFTLYFEEGADIGQIDVLADVAGEAGLDEAAVRRDLATDLDAAEVRREIAEAQRIGVSGVPFFIFQGRLAVSGAQEPEVLIDAIEQARAAPVEPVE